MPQLALKHHYLEVKHQTLAQVCLVKDSSSPHQQPQQLQLVVLQYLVVAAYLDRVQQEDHFSVHLQVAHYLAMHQIQEDHYLVKLHLYFQEIMPYLRLPTIIKLTKQKEEKMMRMI